MANVAKVAVAPEKLAGDSIELTPLVGKMVGVYCRARDKKTTRFGERSMTHVLIAVDGAPKDSEPLEGIMFQTYFQDLKLDQWYVGIVSKVSAGRNDAWVLKSDKLDKAKTTAFVKLLTAIDPSVQMETFL